jgi:type VI secretion system protein VasG
MVPYLPISQNALGDITRLKLNQLLNRLRNNQRIDATYSDEMIEAIARQCTQVDTGARNIDHILRATLLPMLSSSILERMAEGNMPKKMQIGIDADQKFTVSFPE